MKYFVAGLGVGVGLGVIFAPRPGAETRNSVRRQASRRAAALYDGTCGKASELLSRISRFTGFDMLDSRQSVEDKLVEILNHATEAELMSVTGIGPATAQRIVRHRPYFSERQVLEERVLRQQTFIHLKEELVETAAPVDAPEIKPGVEEVAPA